MGVKETLVKEAEDRYLLDFKRETGSDFIKIQRAMENIYRAGFEAGAKFAGDNDELWEKIPGIISGIIIDHGQKDKNIKLGETIKYSPTEIEPILFHELRKEIPEWE